MFFYEKYYKEAKSNAEGLQVACTKMSNENIRLNQKVRGLESTIKGLEQTLVNYRMKQMKTPDDWCQNYFVGTKEKPNDMVMITRRDNRKTYKKEFASVEEAEAVATTLAQSEPGIEFVILAPVKVVRSDIPVTIKDFE